MCRKRMSQHVWTERSREVGPHAICLENLPKSDAAQRSAARVDEQARDARLDMAHKRWTRFTFVLTHPIAGLSADRNDAFLTALSNAGQILGLEVQIIRANTHQFRHAHAG